MAVHRSAAVAAGFFSLLLILANKIDSRAFRPLAAKNYQHMKETKDAAHREQDYIFAFGLFTRAEDPKRHKLVLRTRGRTPNGRMWHVYRRERV